MCSAKLPSTQSLRSKKNVENDSKKRFYRTNLAFLSHALQDESTQSPVTLIQAFISLNFSYFFFLFQAAVNECFLILIEIIELICKSGGAYCTEVAIEYHIDQIIDDLTDFLRFIREMTSNYSRNDHKINRNNSISILFLLCRLIIFKENAKCTDDDETIPVQSSRPSESILDLDISQRLKRIALNSSCQPFNTIKNFDSSSNTIDDNSSVSTLGNYVTATENMAGAGGDGSWRKELQIALLDYPLKHFYPQVVDLIAYALKVLHPYNDIKYEFCARFDI